MGTTDEISRQDIAKKERELDRLYSELQEKRLKIDRKREAVASKRRAFSELLQEEYEISTAILQQLGQEINFEQQSLHQYLASYDSVAEEASRDELKQLELQEEDILDEYYRERRRLEWEIEDDYRQLRDSD